MSRYLPLPAALLLLVTLPARAGDIARLSSLLPADNKATCDTMRDYFETIAGEVPAECRSVIQFGIEEETKNSRAAHLEQQRDGIELSIAGLGILYSMPSKNPFTERFAACFTSEAKPTTHEQCYKFAANAAACVDRVACPVDPELGEIPVATGGGQTTLARMLEKLGDEEQPKRQAAQKALYDVRKTLKPSEQKKYDLFLEQSSRTDGDLEIRIRARAILAAIYKESPKPPWPDQRHPGKSERPATH